MSERATSFDFEIELDGNSPLGLNVSDDLIVLGYITPDDFGMETESSVLQALDTGAILVGERIIAVNGEPLTDLEPPAAIGKLREYFSEQPKEEVVCSTALGKQTCTRVSAQHEYKPTVLRIRPPEVYSPLLLEQIINQKITDANRSVSIIKSFDEGLQSEDEAIHHSHASAAEDNAFAFCSDSECFFHSHHGKLRVTQQRESLTGNLIIHQDRQFLFASALFGGAFPCESRRAVYADPLHACEILKNEDRVVNAVILVERGKCEFHRKALFAQRAGAAGLVVINNDNSSPIRMPAPKVSKVEDSTLDGDSHSDGLFQDSDASSEDWKIHVASAMISDEAGKWILNRWKESTELGAAIWIQFLPFSESSLTPKVCENAREEYSHNRYLRVEAGRRFGNRAPENFDADTDSSEADSRSAAQALLNAILSNRPP
eukprot:gb/GECG01005448.1/.p1 GENE.gb/GECG01005448.1/~~gb/GECG01005448.1/.p1  ORF type:complete len:432 (+),score=54.61 gb/GECG01005448.1/:1-1296(+)